MVKYVVTPSSGRKVEGVLIVDDTGVPINAANPLATTATISGDVNVDSTATDSNALIGKVSGGDFTTAYASGTTITCASLPSYHSTLIASDIVVIQQTNTSGSVVNTYTRDDRTMSVAGNVISVTGATFAASDTFVVYTNIARVSTITATCNIDGYYNASTNPTPDTTGLVVAGVSATPGLSDQTIRLTGGKNDGDGLTSANLWGVDSRALGYMYNSSTWDRVRGTTTDGLLVNLGSNNDVTGTGTAGTAATGVVTVQGIASMTALSTVGTGTAGTPAGGILTVQGVTSMTPLLATVTGSVSTSGTVTEANSADIKSAVSIPTTLTGGSTTVTTAGTGVTLGTTLATKSIYIRAKSTNTSFICVGNSNVDKTTSQQIILNANDSLVMEIANRTTVWIDSNVNGEGVDYLCMS